MLRSAESHRRVTEVAEWERAGLFKPLFKGFPSLFFLRSEKVLA